LLVTYGIGMLIGAQVAGNVYNRLLGSAAGLTLERWPSFLGAARRVRRGRPASIRKRCFARGARVRPTPWRPTEEGPSWQQTHLETEIHRRVGSGLAFTIVPRHVLGGAIGRRATSSTSRASAWAAWAAATCGAWKARTSTRCATWIGRAPEDAFQTYPKAKRYKDYREMFDREAKSIDAVTVTRPTIRTPRAGMLAMKAGKQHYIQKPLARTMGRGASVGGLRA